MNIEDILKYINQGNEVYKKYCADKNRNKDKVKDGTLKPYYIKLKTIYNKLISDLYQLIKGTKGQESLTDKINGWTPFDTFIDSSDVSKYGEIVYKDGIEHLHSNIFDLTELALYIVLLIETKDANAIPYCINHIDGYNYDSHTPKDWYQLKDALEIMGYEGIEIKNADGFKNYKKALQSQSQPGDGQN